MLTPAQKLKNQYEFEAFCKKVIAQERKDFDKSVERRAKRECNFSDLPPSLPESFRSREPYPGECYIFKVMNQPVPIYSDRLAEALLSFSADECSIVLLSYGMDFKDREIAALIGMSRSTVQRRRDMLFTILQKKMKEE